MSEQKPLWGLWYDDGEQEPGWNLDYFGQPLFSESIRLVRAHQVARDRCYEPSRFFVREVGPDGHPKMGRAARLASLPAIAPPFHDYGDEPLPHASCSEIGQFNEHPVKAVDDSGKTAFLDGGIAGVFPK